MNATPRLNHSSTPYHTSGQLKRESVLIIAHGDGRLEAYAESHINVRIEVMPHMNAPENEVMAEQYLEGTLPKRYRDLYWPIKRRAFFHVRIIRPLDIQDRNFVLEMLQTIQKIGDRRAEERKT